MIKMLAEHVLPHVDGLTLIMAGNDDGIITISVISDKKKLAVAPINIKGPAAEVEAELERAIQKIFIDKAALLSNVDEVAEEVKPEEKSTVSKGTAGKNVKTTTSKSSTKTKIKAEETEEEIEEEEEEEVKLTADQKKEAKTQEKNFERAEKTTDIDVVNFVEKEVLKAYEKVKMPEQKIAEAKERFEACRTKIGTGAKSTTEQAPAGEGLFTNASTTPADKPKEKKEESKAEPVKEEKKAEVPATDPPEEMIF